MIEKQLTVLNALGLHARAAARLVSLSMTFDATVELTQGSKSANGKSMLGVMMLASPQHSILTARVDGTDEAAAMHSLEALFTSRFGEDE